MFGRFLSPDIVLGSQSQPQSWNRYAYVRGNPMKLVDPTGEYVVQCMDSADCEADKKAFEKARQDGLKSEVEGERQAALAYGDPGVDNGVTVEFGAVEGTDGGWTRSNGMDVKGDGLVANVTVRIRTGLRGRELRAAVGHEGSHLQDRQAYVASADRKTGLFNEALNLTAYETESRAYLLTHRILKATGGSAPTYGGVALGGRRITDAAVRKAIDTILANRDVPYTASEPGPRIWGD